MSCQAKVKYNQNSILDPESFTIAIDDHSSCCMKNDIKDFIGPLKPKKITIKGFQHSTSMVYGIGTIKWWIQDDDGRAHNLIIHDTLDVPNVKQRRFCPQQWAQQRNDYTPMLRGTYVIQEDKNLELH